MVQQLQFNLKKKRKCKKHQNQRIVGGLRDSILKSRDITLPTKVRLVKAMVFPVVMYGCESWLWRKLSAEKLMLLNCGFGEDSWESLGLQGDPTSPFWRRSVLGVHWKDWCWSWNSSTLATSCEELTHWKRPWFWEGLGAGGEGDDRGWDGWMASPTQQAWVWARSGSWWWTGEPGVLRFMGSQRVRHDWATELNWTVNAGKVTELMDMNVQLSLMGISLKKKKNWKWASAT